MEEIFNWPLTYLLDQLNLKDYIEPGKISQKMSLTYEISIKNSKIKSIPLDSWMIPLAVHPASKIQSVSLSADIRRRIIKLKIDYLTLVLTPKTIKAYNQQQWQEEKFSSLAQWEAKQAEKFKSDQDSGKWKRILLNVLTSSLKVNLTNLTLCYQDNEKIKILGFPCLLMLKIDKLVLKRILEETPDDKILVQAMFYNVSVVLYADPRDDQREISTKIFYEKLKLTERNYLVKPFCIEIKSSFDLNSKSDEIFHEFMVNIEDKIEIAINEYQRFFLEGFINYLSTKPLKLKYSFLRPETSIKNDPGSWWKYIINTGRHDKRINLLNILNTNKKKNKYKELYKRKQQIVFNPRTQKLSESEAKLLSELEEALSLEEILNFRQNAIEELRNEVSEMYPLFFDQSVSLKNKDEFEHYVNEFYASVKEELQTPINQSQIGLPTDNVSSGKAHSFSVTIQLTQVFVYLQSLNTKKIPYLGVDHHLCSCSECAKYVSPSEHVEKAEQDYKESDATEQIVSQKGGLLPLEKMRDVAVEYGSDLYLVTPADYKANNKVYEKSFVKERTILMFYISEISTTLDIHHNGYIQMRDGLSIKQIHNFDPLLQMSADLGDKVFSLKYPKDFFEWIFLNEKKKRPLWALRTFMIDRKMGAEFEVLAHYLEYKYQRSYCICGRFTTKIHGIYESFIKSFNGISQKIPGYYQNHLSVEADFAVRKLYEDLKAHVLNKVIPYFIMFCLRYIIHDIGFEAKGSEHFLMKMQLIKKTESITKKNIVEGICEIAVKPLSFLISNDGIEMLVGWAKFPKPRGMFPKPFYKKTFLKTVESTCPKLNKFKNIMKNWSRNPRLFHKECYQNQLQKSSINFGLQLSQISIYLLDSRNLAMYRDFPLALLQLDNIVISSDENTKVYDEEEDPETFQINKFCIHKCFYKSLGINIDSVSLSSLNRVLCQTSLAVQMNICTINSHPLYPSLTMDVSIPNIALEIREELVVLLNILASINPSTAVNDKTEQTNLFYIQTVQAMQKFVDLEKEQLNHILQEQYLVHFDDSGGVANTCLHCALLHTKYESCFAINIGSSDGSIGLNLVLVDEDSPALDLTVKFLGLAYTRRVFSEEISVFSTDIELTNDLNECIILNTTSGAFLSPFKQPHLLKMNSRYLQMLPHFILDMLPFYASLVYTVMPESSRVAIYNKLRNTDIMIEHNWRRAEGFGRVLPRNTERRQSRMTTISGGRIRRREHSFAPVKKEEALTIEFSGLAVNVICGSSKLIRGFLVLKALLKMVETNKKAQTNAAVILSTADAFSLKFNLREIEFRATVESKVLAVNVLAFTACIKQPFYDYQKNLDCLSVSKSTTIALASMEIAIDTCIECDLGPISACVYVKHMWEAYEHNHTIKLLNQNSEFQVTTKMDSIKIRDVVNGISLLELPFPFSTGRNSVFITFKKNQSQQIFVSCSPLGLNLSNLTIKTLVDNMTAFNFTFPEEPCFTIKKTVSSPSIDKQTSDLVLLVRIAEIKIDLMLKQTVFLELSSNENFLYRGVPIPVIEEAKKYNSLDDLAKVFEFKEANSEDKSVYFTFKELIFSPAYDLSIGKVLRSNNYPLLVKISPEITEIIVQEVQFAFINVVVDDLVYFIKKIKTKIPKKSKEPKAVNVLVIVKDSKLLIPSSTNGEDMLEVAVKAIYIKTGLQTVKWEVPYPLIEGEFSLVEGKHVIGDGYLPFNDVLCDTVTIEIEKAAAFLKGEEFTSVRQIQIDALVPYKAQELVEVNWKHDNYINIRLEDAEIHCSLDSFEVAQKILNSNLDEEPKFIPKVKKWNWTDLNIHMKDGKLEMKEYVLKNEKEKPRLQVLDDDSEERNPPSERVPDSPSQSDYYSRQEELEERKSEFNELFQMLEDKEFLS